MAHFPFLKDVKKFKKTMNSEAVQTQVEEIITPLLANDAVEVVDVTCQREGGRWVLRVFIDKPDGVNLDDCAHVSRKIGDIIDIEEIIPHRYVLEVSSPGLNRVLKKETDFQKFSGKKVKLKIREAKKGRKNFKGRIVQCEDGILEFESTQGDLYSFSLTNIEKARLEIEPDL